MNRMVKVNFRNTVTKEFAADTTLLEVSHSFKRHYNYPILIAKIDNDILCLSEKITRRCTVEFCDRSDPEGNAAYGRSVQFMLIVAIKKVLGEDVEVVIEHSLDNGVYCEIYGAEIDKHILKKIEDKMLELVKQDLLYVKVSVSRMDAIKYFKKKKQIDKVKVLKYISNTYVNLYRLDDIYDYFHGDLAYSTKDIDSFKLTYLKDNGFVLSYPNVYTAECTLDYVHHEKIYQTFLDYTKWGKIMEIQNVADLNTVVSTGKYDELIMLSEAYFNSQLTRIGDEINNNRENIKLVLIGGPSSSGKTTMSKKLEVQLRSLGLKTHQISIDNYFVNRKDTPKDENGEYDFESLKAIDLNLFNQHLMKLLEGERVLLPEYNFVLGEREYKQRWLQLGPNDLIIIEGLHALNEDLTMSIDRKNKYKIYISPLTQINIDNHNRIHTSDTRKLRRIIRDNKTRGYTASNTLNMWKKIREGEEKYIFPFQDEADIIVNSALIYELGVLKTYAEPLLFSVEPNDPAYPEAIRLINFLRNFLPIPSDNVPKDSILREFIGGSCFNK